MYGANGAIGATTLVTASATTSPSGGTSDISETPLISANGRYVVFRSDSINLVPNFSQDHGHSQDLHFHDLQTRTTTLITAGDGEGNVSSPSISADGQVITFVSTDRDLISGHLPSTANANVFAYNMSTGKISLVSVDTAGTDGGNGASSSPVVSPNVKYVAFQSSASNLVANDTNNASDVFLHNLQTGVTSSSRAIRAAS